MQDDVFKEYSATPKSRKPIPTYIIVIILVLALVGMMVGGIFIGAGIYNVSKSAKEMVTDMPLLEEIYSYIDKYYYKDVDWEELQKYAAAGMAGALDPFSGLSLTEIPLSLKLGITMSATFYNEYYITRVDPNSPAGEIRGNECDAAGNITNQMPSVNMERGDRLLSINGIAITGVNIANVNTLYGLTNELIVRKTDGSFAKFTMTRALYNSSEAEYVSLGNGVGMIKLHSFTGNAIEDFAKAAEAFVKDTSSNKLILDLRDNGGGSTDILANIASYFIKDKKGNNYNVPVMRLETKHGNMSCDTVSATSSTGFANRYFGDVKEGYRLAVLTNGNSASASEALLGAIKYYEPSALIVGTPTYGKGIAQQTFEVGDGMYYLSVTVGYFYVPVDNNGSISWKTYHETPQIPVSYNFADDDKYNANYGKYYNNISDEVDVAKAIELLKS